MRQRLAAMPAVMWHLPIIGLIASSAAALETDASLTVRILPAAKVSAQDWLSSERRMERVTIDEQGRALLLRTIEHE